MAAVDMTQLNALVADLQEKEQTLADEGDTNDAAQSAAQAAVAQASATLSAKNAAHDALSTSIDNLVAYVQGLKEA